MLRDLSKHLDVRGETDPGFIMEAISGGHHWALDWEYQSLFHGDIDHDVLAEVVGVLEMWHFMESGYDKLYEEKTRVAQEAAPSGATVRFPGFDGNYEVEHLNLANFFVNRMDHFDRFRCRNLNSHAPLADAYRRMHPVLESMRRSLVAGGELSGSEIAALLQVWRNPSSPIPS